MTIKKTANISNVENNKQDTRVRSANKRPRAPIACFRCHHKKVSPVYPLLIAILNEPFIIQGTL
jgi:hypothetical protein